MFSANFLKFLMLVVLLITGVPITQSGAEDCEDWALRERGVCVSRHDACHSQSTQRLNQCLDACQRRGGLEAVGCMNGCNTQVETWNDDCSSSLDTCTDRVDAREKTQCR